MPLIETKGAASAQGFGEFAKVGAANYIEDVFSTWLYTGNSSGSSTQTITNGIDLSTKGGLVWIKSRSAAGNNWTQDTARGVNSVIYPNLTNAAGNPSGTAVSSFDTTGFSLGTNTNTNNSGTTYASWTFRKQPKFFDIVTYTGDDSTNRQIPHSLGSVPGCIIVKCTSAAKNWPVYHQSIGNTRIIYLNSTVAQSSASATFWNNTTPTSTVFTVGDYHEINQSGQTYVAYLFAHNAGGFGLTGTDNVISCGSFTVDGSGAATIDLGYEPQWLLVKSTASTGANGEWTLFDTMRGWPVTTASGPPVLRANSSAAEGSWAWGTSYVTSTGFYFQEDYANQAFIYIAIRRGPMKTPTTGTSVYTGITRTGTGANATVTGTGFPVDLLFSGSRNAAFGTIDFDRLRGATQRLFTYSTAAEAARSTSLTSFAVQDGYTIGDDATDGGLNNSGQTYIYWNFRRAPGFFDVVCYTGNGVNGYALSHNLGVAPELAIFKERSAASSLGWPVTFGFSSTAVSFQGLLNDTGATYQGTNVTYASSSFIKAQPTASTITVGNFSDINDSGQTYVAYLFASCPGVSKVGSYTGNGSSQTINCGFTGGARFVMVKRTSSTGNWMVVDTARGLVAAGDPTLYLNSTAAEVTGVDWLDPDSSGFIVNQEATMNANVNGATYLFLAIA